MFRAFLYSFAGLVAASTDDSKVLVLTDSTIADEIAKYPKGILVEFYAPWCGHCKSLEPEYNKASALLEEQKSEYKLAKVDATVEKDSAQKYGVQGFPTLKWFVDGSPMEYDGPRESQGIVDWIKTMTGPAVSEEEPEANPTSAVITFYGEKIEEKFESVAKKYRKAAKFYFKKGEEKVTFAHPGEEPIEIKGDDVKDEAAIDAAYKANSFPLFGKLDGETFQNYVSREGYGMVWGLFEMTTENFLEKVAEQRPMMTKVATALPKMSVTFTNTAEFAQVLDSMFAVKTFPKVVVQKKGGDKKYFVYDGEIDADKIIEYVKKIESGEIQPNLKSEEAPAEPQADPVKVIVGKTLQEKVFTADKDVMLEVYAPWCGHCKKLDPEYIKVGKKVAAEGFEDKIIIAKMDGTTNDSPVDSIEWSGFPTIVFIKKGSDAVTTYDGERTAKGMWQWIKKNSSYAEEIVAKIDAKKAEKEEKTEL